MRMFRNSSLVLIGLLVLVAGCKRSSETTSPDPLSGTYELVSSESMVSFTSIKNHDIPVSGTFDKLSGSIKVGGKKPLNETTGKIQVDLTSLNTENKKRDQNILVHFFRAAGDNIVSKKLEYKIEKMQFRTEVSSPLSLNRPVPLTAIGQLSAFESSKTQKTQLTVTRTGPDRVLVTTRKPLAFLIDKYEMGEPLKKMMEVCEHGAISNVVPAQFYLVFEKSTSS